MLFNLNSLKQIFKKKKYVKVESRTRQNIKINRVKTKDHVPISSLEKASVRCYESSIDIK